MLLCFHRPGLRLLPAITIDCLQVTFWDESNISQITRREHFIKNPAELFVYLVLYFCSILIEILFQNGCL